MAFPGKREGLAQKVDTAAIEAERLGLTTATLILRMARLEIDRAEPDEVESMPRKKSARTRRRLKVAKGTPGPASQTDGPKPLCPQNSKLIGASAPVSCRSQRTWQ